jgi:hypothetical protein
MSEPASTSSPKSNALFSTIVATVAATAELLTVRQLAERVGASPAVTAQCIALHRYLRAHAQDACSAGLLSIPAPADFMVPDADEVIDEVALGLPECARPRAA